MDELQQVLNKFRIIDETLSSIPSFADFTWNNNQKKFITKLAEFNSKQEMGLSSISNSKREKILEKWNLYINSDSKSHIIFDLKEVEFLSTQTNIFLNDSFWDLLMDLPIISHKIIIGLVYNIHILWTEIKDFNKIIDSITFMILEYKQDNKIIQFWRENIELVLSEKSPINLATKLVDENLNLSTLSDKYYLSLMTPDEEKYAMNILTHVDFLIFDEIGKSPRIVIEVDGVKFHAEGTRQAERDVMKNSILNKYGLPILRFKTDGSNEREKLLNAIGNL